MKFSIVALLVFLSFSAYSFQQLKPFKETLKQVDMAFTVPEGFAEVTVTPNDVMEYEYAIGLPDKSLEIRYAVRPITLKSYEDEEEKQQYLENAEVENTRYNWFMMVTILNLTGGREIPIQELSFIGQLKLGSDWAGQSTLKLYSEFADYQFCQLMVIHKKNKATAYYFYLANDLKILSENLPKAHGSLSFR